MSRTGWLGTDPGPKTTGTTKHRGAQSMQIVMVSSEVAPFSKEGGLADVIGALPVALGELGQDVRIISPLYRGVRQKAEQIGRPLERLDPGEFTVPVGEDDVPAAVWRTTDTTTAGGSTPGPPITLTTRTTASVSSSSPAARWSCADSWVYGPRSSTATTGTRASCLSTCATYTAATSPTRPASSRSTTYPTRASSGTGI